MSIAVSKTDKTKSGIAFLYRALSQAEKQPALAEVYRRLALTEQAHAEV
ncbi:hypothetical protein [Leptolyngbya sp. NIES-2104]|nr:hypothetical protein [Leptolyngbya sp. NIES-2104]GAP99971.1 hypothetical protein NIES2104_65370 [Leptolyngbya sp. NIES-2104]